MTRQRLDHVLVARGLVATRSRARDLILRGEVVVDGKAVMKPAEMVGPAATISLDAAVGQQVSRGAAKLEAALDAFGLSPAGLCVIDVGASTGGFTQVLLQRGAARVHAVDVGRDQLHAALREDARVVVHEGVDARQIGQGLIGAEVDAVVADVSFISLRKALPAALDLVKAGGWLVALIKPQFEAGPEAVGKGGIVREAAAREAANGAVREFLETAGWRVAGVIPSPLPGKDGNQESLIGAWK